MGLYSVKKVLDTASVQSWIVPDKPFTKEALRTHVEDVTRRLGDDMVTYSPEQLEENPVRVWSEDAHTRHVKPAALYLIKDGGSDTLSDKRPVTSAVIHLKDEKVIAHTNPAIESKDTLAITYPNKAGAHEGKVFAYELARQFHMQTGINGRTALMGLDDEGTFRVAEFKEDLAWSGNSESRMKAIAEKIKSDEALRKAAKTLLKQEQTLAQAKVGVAHLQKRGSAMLHDAVKLGDRLGEVADKFGRLASNEAGNSIVRKYNG